MSHKSKNIIDEVVGVLNEMRAFGQSRHEDKKNNDTKGKIYSYITFDIYKKRCVEFVLFTKEHHKCRSVQDARTYVDEFLKMKMEKGYSAYTIKQYASAIGKLYQEPTTNFITTQTRHRENITRSRNECVRDKHFSEIRNKEFVEFAKCVGLRRSEMENLRGGDLRLVGEQYFIYVSSGKGGKSRMVEVYNNSPVVIEKMKNTKDNARVWGKISSACDVHHYRSVYCQRIYEKYARPFEEIPKESRYYCRRDFKGICLDVSALQRCSQNLGHSRINIVPFSYLRK